MEKSISANRNINKNGPNLLIPVQAAHYNEMMSPAVTE